MLRGSQFSVSSYTGAVPSCISRQFSMGMHISSGIHLSRHWPVMRNSLALDSVALTPVVRLVASGDKVMSQQKQSVIKQQAL